MDKDKVSQAAIIAKTCVVIAPATLLEFLMPVHSRLLYGLSLILGVLLQALIPPRRTGLAPTIIAVVIFTIVYSLI